MAKYKAHIIHDDNPINPREDFDINIGTIVYKHSKYVLGDLPIDDAIDFLEDMLGLKHRGVYNNERLSDLEKLFMREFIVHRVYLYDHSGIAISTEPFQCTFDSGQIGWIYTTKEKARKTLGVKRLTQKNRRGIKKMLNFEIEKYGNFLSGNFYGVIVQHEDGDEVASCYGFSGSDWKNNGISEFVYSQVNGNGEKHEIEFVEDF